MKKLFKFCAIALSAIFLSISANAADAEGFKCKTGLNTNENTKAKQFGKVEIPQEAFIGVLKINKET